MIRNFTKLLSFSSLAMLCTFIYQAYASHILTPGEYGVLARWLTDLNYFGLFLVFGLDNALLFFSKNQKLYPENIARNFIFFFTIGFLVLSCFLLSGEITWYVISLVLSIIIFACYQSLNACNQLREQYNKYGLFVFLKPLLLLFALIAVSLLWKNITAKSVYISYTVVGLFLLLVIGSLYVRDSSLVWPRKVISKEYFSYGGKSMFNTLLAISLYTSTIYCIDFLQGKEAVGYFFIASAVAKLAWVLPDAVGNILYPRFLKIGGEYKKNEILSEAYKLGRIVVIINFAAVVMFAFIGSWFVEIIFGKEAVAKAYPLIIILLVGNQGMALYKILGRYLASSNSWRVMHVALVTSVVVNVTLNFVLNPIWGALGSAIATSISFWVCGVIVAYNVPGSIRGFFYIHRVFKVD